MARLPLTTCTKGLPSAFSYINPDHSITDQRLRIGIFPDMKTIIRKMTEDDIPGIHALVRELAEYERGLHKVTTTPETYGKDFEDRIFDAVCHGHAISVPKEFGSQSGRLRHGF